MTFASLSLSGKIPVSIITLIRCVSGFTNSSLTCFNNLVDMLSNPALVLLFMPLIAFSTSAFVTAPKSNVGKSTNDGMYSVGCIGPRLIFSDKAGPILEKKLFKPSAMFLKSEILFPSESKKKSGKSLLLVERFKMKFISFHVFLCHFCIN